MDNIWIFLVIIGAVISMVQKNQQKNRPTEQNSDPTLDPQAEWERRMREIFGEQKSTTPAPEQIPTPTATQTQVLESSPTISTPTTNSAVKPKMSRNANKSKATSNISTATHLKANTANRGTNRAKSSDPIKAGDITAQKGEISGIIEDFTMEKAVIYSEILRPKFEE